MIVTSWLYSRGHFKWRRGNVVSIDKVLKNALLTALQTI